MSETALWCVVVVCFSEFSYKRAHALWCLLPLVSGQFYVNIPWQRLFASCFGVKKIRIRI